MTDEAAPAADERLAKRVARTVAGFLGRLEQRSPRVERVLMVVAVIMFVGAGVVAWRNFPDLGEPLRWELFVLVGAVLIPATMAVNAAEFVVTARAVERRVPFGEAFRVTVLANAANILPVPGSVLVRTRALRQLGSGYRGALSSVAAVGFIWVSTAGLLASGFLAADGQVGLAAPFAVGGVAGLGLSTGLLVASVERSRVPRLMTQMVVVELASTGLTAVRLLVILIALGVEATWVQAFGLGLVAIIASASGIFPGGLGIREVLSGAFSPLIGLPAAVGLATSAVERILIAVTLSGFAVFFALRGRAAVAEVPESADEAPG